MIRLTREIRFNYRLRQEREWRFDVLPKGRQFNHGERDKGGAMCVIAWVGSSMTQQVRVPLAPDEFEEQKVFWT
jgi:hypothetical protein